MLCAVIGVFALDMGTLLIPSCPSLPESVAAAETGSGGGLPPNLKLPPSWERDGGVAVITAAAECGVREERELAVVGKLATGPSSKCASIS